MTTRRCAHRIPPPTLTPFGSSRRPKQWFAERLSRQMSQWTAERRREACTRTGGAAADVPSSTGPEGCVRVDKTELGLALTAASATAEPVVARQGGGHERSIAIGRSIQTRRPPTREARAHGVALSSV